MEIKILNNEELQEAVGKLAVFAKDMNGRLKVAEEKLILFGTNVITLDSYVKNEVMRDMYITGLERRIADLESKIVADSGGGAS